MAGTVKHKSPVTETGRVADLAAGHFCPPDPPSDGDAQKLFKGSGSVKKSCRIAACDRHFIGGDGDFKGFNFDVSRKDHFYRNSLLSKVDPHCFAVPDQSGTETFKVFRSTDAAQRFNFEDSGSALDVLRPGDDDIQIFHNLKTPSMPGLP